LLQPHHLLRQLRQREELPEEEVPLLKVMPLPLKPLLETK
jgi:hypothetical protein